MKKFRTSNHAWFQSDCRLKFLRITKFTTILLLFTTVQVFADGINSQNTQAAESLQQRTITGTVVDSDGQTLQGVSVSLKGTTTGTITDADGNYTLPDVPGDAILVISYVGMTTQEIPVGNQTTISIIMEPDMLGLEEVVVVGYGTKKKINLTGAVSVASGEDLENRPVANVQQALQGVVPNLQITVSTATGEPGADMAMNIRGLTSIEGNSSPYVLVDNIPMNMNDVDPNDIESISVLKDVASSAIYGARAAYGVILITTKSGKSQQGIKVSYSGNFGSSSVINMPQNADPLSFAHTFNHAAINSGKGPYYTEEKLGWIEQNMADPGSAPEVLEHPNGLKWDLGTDGLNASAATDWDDIIFKDSSPRQKHNLNLSGGNDRFNFYLSGGLYNEKGMLKQANDAFKRYNVDAKISAKATKWMDISLIAKYKYGEEDYPEHKTLGRSFIMLLMTRLKPTKPAYYPGTEVWTGRIGDMELNKTNVLDKQLVLSPRITLEPVKGWVTNLELNYRTNNINNTSLFPQIPSAVPDGTGGSVVTWPSLESTVYRSNMYSNSYLSPNIYTSYTREFGRHDVHVLAGYQQETYNYFNLRAEANHLLTTEIPSISTAVGEKVIQDDIGHWATQGLFGRLNYGFADKYLVEFNFRYDGSSRFEPDSRWGFFPSVSAGWVISNEDFFPIKNVIEVLKLRGSYGSIGNQNVANYLYVPTMSIAESNYLFGGERLWTVGTPNLTSVNLTWEKVNTMDFGFDLLTLGSRLGITFDWYESKTTDLVGPGEAVPTVLGTGVPKKNGGEITTRGWEVEISWRHRVNEFAYGIRGILSDYRSRVTSYTNPTKILSTYYEGMALGEIWGLETDGLFQSENEVAEYPNDQSYLYSGTWYPGDMRYVDQDGDGVIGIGDNTSESSGDKFVIGNSTPRFQFGLSANASWKGIDLSFLIQGIGKRDLDIRKLGTFRGPANGPLHGNAYEEHLDFWRDETSPLGANPDAYYPNPYVQYTGQNNKNYRLPTTRFLQNGAYLRLKNVQLGYTIPLSVTGKVNISSARIYVSGENLLTFTKLMIYDPEAYDGRTGRYGDQYPLSRVFSIGININF